MEGSGGVPKDEKDWANYDVSELFGATFDASTLTVRLARALPSPTVPACFPATQMTSSYHVPESAIGCVVDAYFTPDLAQMEATLDALTLEATRQCRSLHTPFQTLFERRIAIMQRACTAVTNTFAECDGKPENTEGSAALRRICVVPLLDMHPSIAAPPLLRRVKSLPLSVQTCVSLMLMMLTSFAETNQSLAADVMYRLEHTLLSLPPYCLSETASSFKMSPDITGFARQISDLLKKLLQTMPGHTRKLVELWVHLAICLGSLEALLDIVTMLDTDQERFRNIELSVGGLLGLVHKAHPVPFLAWPAQNSAQGQGGQAKMVPESITRIPCPVDAVSPCIVSVAADSSNSYAYLLVPRHALMRVTVGKRSKATKYRPYSGVHLAQRQLMSMSSAASIMSMHDAPRRRSRRLTERSFSLRRLGDDATGGEGRGADGNSASNNVNADDDVSPSASRPAGAQPPLSHSSRNVPGNPVHDGGSIVSSVKVEGMPLLLYVHSMDTAAKPTDGRAWDALDINFDMTVICASSLEDITTRTHVAVQVYAEDGPAAAKPLSSRPDTLAAVTRVVHATAEEALFLTTLRLAFSKKTAVANVIFRVPLAELMPSVALTPAVPHPPADAAEGREVSPQGGRPIIAAPPQLRISTAGRVLKHGVPRAHARGLADEIGSLSFPLYLRTGVAPVKCGALPHTSVHWPPAPSTSLTIEAWVRLDTLEEPATIYRHGCPSKLSEVFIEVSPGEVGHIWRCGARGSTVSCKCLLSEPDGLTGKWMHVAAVFDEKARTCSMMLNGEISKTQVRSSVPQLWVSSDTGPVIGNGVYGHVAHVKLWNVARRQETIRLEMRKALTGTEPHLVGYWTLSEGCGSIIYDRGPHGMHGQQLPEQNLPDGSGVLQWAECGDLDMDLGTPADEALRPVVDTGVFSAVLRHTDSAALAPLFQVIAYSNMAFIAVGALPYPEQSGNWLLRFYSVATGCIEYERLVHCHGLSYEPQSVTYDSNEHKLWMTGVVNSELVVQRVSAPYFPPRSKAERAREYAEAAGDPPTPTEGTVCKADELVVTLLHCADMEALAGLAAPIPRLSHPLTVDASVATMASLLSLLEKHIAAPDARGRYIRDVSLRLLQCNCESIIACEVDPRAFGFAGAEGKGLPMGHLDVTMSNQTLFSSKGSPPSAMELVGDVEVRLWKILAQLAENPECSAKARSLLQSVLLLLLPTPALRVGAATAWAQQSGSLSVVGEDNTDALTPIEKMSFHVLLRHMSKLPSLIAAVRSPAPELQATGTGSDLYLSLISVKLRKSSNLSLFRKSYTSHIASSFNSGLGSGKMKDAGVPADGMLGNHGTSFTHFIITLLKSTKAQLAMRLEAALAMLERRRDGNYDPSAAGPEGAKRDGSDGDIVAVLGCFQKSLVALSVREAAATHVGNEEADDEFYPPITGQLVAYTTELLSAASAAFLQGAGVAQGDDGGWGIVEKEIRSSYVGATLPALVTSLGLLIGTADTALLDMLDRLTACFRALQAFLRQAPGSASRPSTGPVASCRGAASHPDTLTPTFLQTRAVRRGAARKTPWDFWSDLQHSILYVMARACGHVAAASGDPVPGEGPYEKLFSSTLMRAGLSPAGVHEEMSRKSKVIQGLLGSAPAEMQMWANLKKNHLSNKMLGIALNRADDVDEVLRVVYAVVLHHVVPVADFTTLRSSSSQLPVGVLYGFSKVEGIITKLMELKQTHGKAALHQVQERASLLLRFDPGGFVPSVRDLEVRLMLAPGVMDDMVRRTSINSMVGRNDGLGVPPTWSASCTPATQALGTTTSSLVSSRGETPPTRALSGKRNNWKRLFLSWKALRRLHQLLKLNQMHLNKTSSTKANGDEDVATQIVDVVRDPLFDPTEVDALLKKRRARGRLRAKGLERLKVMLSICPNNSSLLDCLVIAVKAVTGYHYCQGLSASGSAVQEHAQNAIYSLVNEVMSSLSHLTAAPISDAMLSRPPSPSLHNFRLDDGPDNDEAVGHILDDPSPKFGTGAPPPDLTAFLLQMLGIPWQASDMGYLLTSRMPQLLGALFSVLPPEVARQGVGHPGTCYIPPGVDTAKIPMPSSLADEGVVPDHATRACIEPEAPMCISFPTVDRLSVRCEPNCSSLRGTVCGSVLWGTANAPEFSTKPVYYYEVTIQELAELGAVAVGLGPTNYDRTRHPGWGPASCAYHGDDGLLFQESGRGRQLGPVFGAGRTVGCGIIAGTKEVFWTLDGRLLPTRITGFAFDVRPMIGIDAKGMFTVNFGAAPFRFDLSKVLSFSTKDKQGELRHLSWQLLQSLTLRASIILLKSSGQQQKNDTEDSEDGHVEPPPQQEDIVMFDQVCSPVHAASMLKSPKMRFQDVTSPLPEKGDSLILAAINPCEAALQLMTSVVSTAVMEVARCVVMWDTCSERDTLVTQLSKCCAMISSTLHGAKLDSNPATGEQLLSCLLSHSAPHYLLCAAALPEMPRGTSHMLLQTLSVALPGIHPSDARCALVPQHHVLRPKADPIRDMLWRLMHSSARCLTSRTQTDACVTSSAWGAMRLLATLARSPTWHRPVVDFIEECLEKQHGEQHLLTSLAVVGGLREQLGTGSLVEYCSEAKAMKERVHVVSLDLEEGTVRIVQRPMRAVRTVPLSTVSLPDPFDWDRKHDRTADPADGAYDKDKKDPWPLLQGLLRSVLSNESNEGSAFDTNASGLSMMVLRAAWVNVKSSPAALKWLAESGLLPHVIAIATQCDRELPLEAAEEKVLMLQSLLAEMPKTGASAPVADSAKSAAMSPLPLRYFATTHASGSPLLSPTMVQRHRAASESEDDPGSRQAESPTPMDEMMQPARDLDEPGQEEPEEEQEESHEMSANESASDEDDGDVGDVPDDMLPETHEPQYLAEQRECEELLQETSEMEITIDEADVTGPPHTVEALSDYQQGPHAMTYSVRGPDYNDDDDIAQGPEFGATIEASVPRSGEDTPGSPCNSGLKLRGGFVSLGCPPRLCIVGPLTIDLLLCLHERGASQELQTVLHRGGTDGEASLLVQVVGMQKIAAGWQYEDGTTVMASFTISRDAVGKWLHIAAVFDGAIWTLHVDGHSEQASPPGHAPLIQHSDWIIGGRSEDARARLYGDLRNIRIWQTALPLQRVRKIASGLPPINNGSMMCFFRCKEREGRKMHDSVWVDGLRLCGELSGKAGWADGHHDFEIEEELDLTTLNDGEGGIGAPLATAAYSAHACVDRAALWRELRRLSRDDMLKELRQAHSVVGRLYARALLIQTIAQWPDGAPMSADALGGTTNICNFLKVLVDSSQFAASEVVRSCLQKMLNDTPEASDMPGTLLNECLGLMEEVPAYIVRESTHPYTRPRRPGPRVVSIPGCTQYRILTDPRSTESGPETLIVVADQECRRVIARNAGSKPWPPLEVKLPRFYFHYKTDANVGGWGYKLVIQYGFERFELGVSLLEQLLSYCTLHQKPVPEPLRLFHTLVAVSLNALSYHRRTILSLITQLVSTPQDWPRDQIPDLAALKPLKIALEKQYARELVNGTCVMHSKYVQSLTELFLAVKRAERAWHRITLRGMQTLPGKAPGSVDLLDSVFYVIDSPVPDSLQQLRGDPDLDGRMMLWPEASRLLVRSGVTMVSGCWHFELKQLTRRGCVAVGIIRHDTSDVYGWKSNRSYATCGLLGNGADEDFLLLDDIASTPEADTRDGNIRKTLGVSVDVDRGTLTVWVNKQAVASCPFVKGERPTDLPVSPCVWVEAKDGVMVNYGTAPFFVALQPGYLPIRSPRLLLSEGLPFNQLRALVDTTSCMLENKPLPPYYHNSQDHFKNMPHRVGPQYVELIATDGVVSNGLECKNTGTAFYTAKANVKVTRGKWYYEATVSSQGLMQIGWATERSVPKPVGGVGVGDDDQSWSVDLFRRQAWHANVPHQLVARKWQIDDIIGCLLDLDTPNRGFISFTLNGEPIQDADGTAELFTDVDIGNEGVYPAASFRANNSLTFNFGGTPLKYQPQGYMALGVPDTWLDRIDAYYNESSEADASQDDDTEACSRWTPEKHRALVSLLNGLCKSQRKNLHQVSLDRTLCTDVWEAHPRMLRESEHEIAKRVAIQKKFSRLAFTIVPLVNFEMASRANLTASVIKRIRDLMLQSVSDDILRSVIKSTNGRAEPIRITLNRRKAAYHKQFPDLDTTGQSSLFGQTFDLIGSYPPSMFKTNQRFWCVVFAGEGAEDVGGPFREHITEMCSELMSPATPLFIPSPNNRSGVGTHRECYVPNPSATHPIHVSMYVFLGRLMGGAIRSNEPLSLYLPPLVWKKLVGANVSVEDLDCVDRLCFQCVENLSSLHKNGVGEDLYHKAFSTETFSTLLSDGTVYDLKHNGSNECVTYDKLDDYAALVANARLNESSIQIEAVRRGLCSVIPEYTFYLMHWQAVELRVCGRSDYTVRELKEYTTLDGLTKDDSRIAFLWQVLEEISASDRRAFLRFVAGRERLPVKLRIMPLFCKGHPDCYLPKAATCFFALELPDYSSVDVMREKLIYAIKNCTDIDTDFRAREIDDDEGPQLAFDEMRHEEQELLGDIEEDSLGSAEEW